MIISYQPGGKETEYENEDKSNFENLDFTKYPNLKTILYDEQGLEKIMAEIGK